MKILYVIALLSFVVLAWAAVAIARHVRRSGNTAEQPLPAPRAGPKAAITRRDEPEDAS